LRSLGRRAAATRGSERPFSLSRAQEHGGDGFGWGPLVGA
jgi:hypothetical protein